MKNVIADLEDTLAFLHRPQMVGSPKHWELLNNCIDKSKTAMESRIILKRLEKEYEEAIQILKNAQSDPTV